MARGVVTEHKLKIQTVPEVVLLVLKSPGKWSTSTAPTF